MIRLISAAGILSLLLATGCQSARQPGSTSHASVQIQGRGLAEVQQTMEVVFNEAGYTRTSGGPDLMVFQRLGSRWDAAKWGGWTGEGVVMLLKVEIHEVPGGAYLLQADAYAVQNSNDPFFHTDSRNILLNRRPYQKLLDEVAKRLK